ncbi:hypothetical protein NKG05_11790 [Oerskovia sp. M15]
MPDPVSPATITTWFSAMALAMSSRRAETGSCSGYVMGGTTTAARRSAARSSWARLTCCRRVRAGRRRASRCPTADARPGRSSRPGRVTGRGSRGLGTFAGPGLVGLFAGRVLLGDLGLRPSASSASTALAPPARGSRPGSPVEAPAGLPAVLAGVLSWDCPRRAVRGRAVRCSRPTFSQVVATSIASAVAGRPGQASQEDASVTLR